MYQPDTVPNGFFLVNRQTRNAQSRNKNALSMSCVGSSGIPAGAAPPAGKTTEIGVSHSIP